MLRAFLGKLWPIRAPPDKGECVSALLTLLCSSHQLQETLHSRVSDPLACLLLSCHNSGPGNRCWRGCGAGQGRGMWRGCGFRIRSRGLRPLVSQLPLHLYNPFDSAAVWSSPNLETSSRTSVFLLNRYTPQRGLTCKILYITSNMLSEFN